MEGFITKIPETPVGWLGLFFLGVVAALWLFNRTRRQDMQILRDSNDDLRKALGDNEKKVEDLTVLVTELQSKVLTLEGQKKTVEDLVVVALEEYFRNNPEAAKALKKKTK